MTDLTPLTPLGGTEPRIDQIGAITITEVTNRARASVAARKGSDVAKGFKALGFKSAPKVTQMLSATGSIAWWMGPDQWMVDADYDTAGSWAEKVKQAMGDTASVTDQTEGFCRFLVSGETAQELFERLCALDVREMSEGDAQRTAIHHMGCVVIHAGDHWVVEGANSSAGSLHHALVEVAHSVS